MKKLNLMLLGALLSQTAFAQTGIKRYLYTYDGAGNIISRIKATPKRKLKAVTEQDSLMNNPEQNGQIHIRTNAFWSAVQIEIDGDVRDGDMLSVYTERGLYVASFRLESNKVTLNLSNLKKGTYLFRYSGDKKLYESKIAKTR